MAALSFIGFLFPLLFIALIVLVIAAVAGGRGEADPSGRRPYAIYLSLVTFVGLMTTIGAVFATVKSIADSILVGGSGPDCPPGFVECGFGGGGSGLRDILSALLVLAASGALTYLHGNKLLELRRIEPGSSSQAARVLQVFAYSVCFMTVFIVLATAVAAATALIDAIDPQQGFGGLGGGSGSALSTLLTSVIVGALSGLLFRYTWTTFDLGLKATAPTAPPPPSF